MAKKRPTVDLVLRLLCPERTIRAARIGEFSLGGNLVKNRLMSVGIAIDLPLLAAPVQLDGQVVALLLRQQHLDPRLAAVCRITVPAADLAALPIDEGWRRTLAALLSRAQDNPAPVRLYLEGPAGSGKSQLAEAIARHLGARLVTVHMSALVQSDNFDERLRLVFREVWLKGGVLYFAGIDGLREDDGWHFSTLLHLLAADKGVTILSGHHPWRAAEFESTGVISLKFDTSAAGVQLASWRRALHQAGITLAERDVDVLAGRFRLGPAQAIEAAVAAANRVRWRNALTEGTADASVTLDDLFAAARLQCGQELADLARRIEPRRGWNDIVLPKESLTQLHEICARVAAHTTVLSDWGFSKRLSLGKGVTALFAGPSGTGKTLAAEIVAFELGLFLYKIDLSGIVSKYIGETEKNLDRVFTAARDANCVLFFDEADALFGKRSEVRDSHDRYANLEISYLLQKMEEFEGLAILATNLRQNLDDAFTRRLAFTVHFPFPDEQERRRIWAEIWPGATPLAADVDPGVLARELKMSGGNIKNTALAAAYYAATDGGVVTHAHLLHAARREFQKMGKVPANLETAAAMGPS